MPSADKFELRILLSSSFDCFSTVKEDILFERFQVWFTKLDVVIGFIALYAVVLLEPWDDEDWRRDHIIFRKIASAVNGHVDAISLEKDWTVLKPGWMRHESSCSMFGLKWLLEE